MKNKLDKASVNELKQGFIFNRETEEYICLFCGNKYEKGRIYKSDNILMEAEKRMRLHINEKHDGAFSAILSEDKKSAGVTDAQKAFLLNYYMGLTDKEIAEKENISPSTVRFQRFNFREKAAQAKIILALSELLEEKIAKRDKELPKKQTVSDEEEKIDSFFISSSPLVLKTFAVKNKNQLFILEIISRQFERGKIYNEKEVTAILNPIYEDHATIRRELIINGFMERTSDCAEYWLK